MDKNDFIGLLMALGVGVIFVIVVGIKYPQPACAPTPITVQDQRFLDSMQEQAEAGLQFRSLVRQYELDNLGANPHITPAQMEAFTREALELYDD